MASRQKAKQKFTSFINIRQWFNFLKRYLIALFVVSASALKRLLRTFENHQKLFLVLLLLLLISVVTFAAIIPGTHVFEGNLIVKEMSFTYDEPQIKPFLKNINSINRLEIEGIQRLSFTGIFQSKSLPQFNQLHSLKIELKEHKSRLIIAPVNPKVVSEINLDKLSLQPNTTITNLNYGFFTKQLAFSLKPNLKSDLKSEPYIFMSLGEQPIKVILEGSKLLYDDKSNLIKQSDEQTPLEFTLEPDNQEFILDIMQNNKINITLSKPIKPESEQWFNEQLATRDVDFLHQYRDSSDNLTISTIVEGKIRMIEQEREIKRNQFLMGENPDKPLNIKSISHLEIIPNKGIEARFSGKTRQIQIGLDKKFPVSKIQGSWLDGVLPRDAIIALFSFGAATVANLLSWLFSHASKSTSKP